MAVLKKSEDEFCAPAPIRSYPISGVSHRLFDIFAPDYPLRIFAKLAVRAQESFTGFLALLQLRLQLRAFRLRELSAEGLPESAAVTHVVKVCVEQGDPKLGRDSGLC
jgi:hypothetical protein